MGEAREEERVGEWQRRERGERGGMDVGFFIVLYQGLINLVDYLMVRQWIAS